MHRLLAPIVFSTVLTIGAATTLTLYNGTDLANETRAEELADKATDSLAVRLGQHLSLLRATKALFEATDSRITKDEFATFVSGLEIKDRYPGIQGIGFAELIPTGSEAQLEAILERDYQEKRAIWPETDQAFRTPIVLLEPLDARNAAAISYDMYSESTRRAAIATAIETGQMTATAPVELVQEITKTKQTGFLVYSPFDNNRRPSLSTANSVFTQKPAAGLVYSPFRAGDLFTAALDMTPSLPVTVKAYDTETPDIPLFVSKDFEALADTGIHTMREIDIAGRKWTLEIQVAPTTAWDIQRIAPYVSAVVFFLLACMLAWITHTQLRALRIAHDMREMSEKNLSEKELMLQEMKHRIKNSIARILAMARQTANHSEDLAEFSDSFNARLQAMANAQDALTRSHWQRADLSDLLSKELKQVLGEEEFNKQISGPPVDLDETSAQALGLTFHELATNALKYSDVSENPKSLHVRWRIQNDKKAKMLSISWSEASSEPVTAPTHKGFGTRLIDANIRGELRGKIDRHYTETGLLVEIVIPLPGNQSPKTLKRRTTATRASE